MSILLDPPTLPLIAPSVLGSDFADLAGDCGAAIDAGADLLHLDVMDGHFVPNLTMGPALVKSLHTALPDVFLDAHLMVQHPEQFVEAFAAAGAHHFSFHVEVCDDPAALAETIRQHGMTAGLTINPPTPVEVILPHLECMDMILVMSVNPGFGGQAFIPEVLDKVRTIAPRLRPDQRLQMDGGVNMDTVAACRDAGADVLVAGSGIFRSGDYAEAIARLRGAPRAVGR